jgi:hypothetical protein
MKTQKLLSSNYGVTIKPMNEEAGLTQKMIGV